MSVRTEVSGEIVVAYLSGEIDHHSAKEIRENIDKAIESQMPTMLVMDFKDVTFMDSSGIGLVMGRYGILRRNNADLLICNTSEYIYKIMKLAGIERLAKLDKGGYIK